MRRRNPVRQDFRDRNKNRFRRVQQINFLRRSQRAVRWLLPGLVVKRWMFTSGIGLIVALLGAAIWADLRPIYLAVEGLFWFLESIANFLPRSFTGHLIFLI